MADTLHQLITRLLSSDPGLGFRPNARGDTMLHMACERRNVKLVHYILDPAYTMQGGERDKAAVLLTGFAEVGVAR